MIACGGDNGIIIHGHTALSFTKDVTMRCEVYGWRVLAGQDGNKDMHAIRKTIAVAKACTDKPSPNKADSHDAHGTPFRCG